MSKPDHHRSASTVRSPDSAELPLSPPLVGRSTVAPAWETPAPSAEQRQRTVSRRIPVRRRIRLELAGVPEPITATTVNLAMTGVFVASKVLAPVGTPLTLELDVGDGHEPIRGRGKVAWVRTRPDGRARPRGLGLRFAGFGEASRRRLQHAVEKGMLERGTFDDLDHLLPTPAAPPSLSPEDAAGEAPPEVDPQMRHPYAGTAAARREGWLGRIGLSGRAALAVAGALLTLALVALIQLW